MRPSINYYKLEAKQLEGKNIILFRWRIKITVLKTFFRGGSCYSLSLEVDIQPF
jgi:hypothetical protein